MYKELLKMDPLLDINKGLTHTQLTLEHVHKNHNEKTFHFILTTSNHPPFTIDVDSLGFKRQDIENKLPNTIDKKSQPWISLDIYGMRIR